MGVKREATLTLNATVEQMMAIIRDPRFSNAVGMTPRTEKPVPGGVEYWLDTSISFTSWGEDITITILSAGGGLVTVIVKSACSLPTQIIDYGKNRKNVEKICNCLQSVLASSAPAVGGYPQSAPQYPAQTPVAQTYTPPQMAQPVYQSPAPAPAPVMQPKCFCIGCGRPLTEVPGHCPGCGRFCPGV